MIIHPIGEKYRAAVNKILKEEWDAPPEVSRGRIIDTTNLPGFVFLAGDTIAGVVTYHIVADECEIITLNSFKESSGVGWALICAVADAARAQGCRRLWLLTSNDNTKAIRYYQRRGFEWVATHIDAITAAREIKPAIPLRGRDDIPIKHEIEFEMTLL